VARAVRFSSSTSTSRSSRRTPTGYVLFELKDEGKTYRGSLE